MAGFPNVLSRHSRSATTVQTRGADAEFYYYLAKALASMSRPNEAIHCLRRALEDGFKDMKRLDDDPDFQKISHEVSHSKGAQIRICMQGVGVSPQGEIGSKAAKTTK